MTNGPTDDSALRLFVEPPDLPDLPVVDAASLPWLTVQQMAEADDLAMNRYGIAPVQMIELAGAALAGLVVRLAPYGLVTVLAGPGVNGAGGLCCARHLVGRGRDVEVVLDDSHAGPMVQRQLQTLAAMGVRPTRDPLGDVAVDALAGYGGRALDGRPAALALWANRERLAVSLDAPSGLGHDGAVVAQATLTLGLPKDGLREVRPLFLADIGIPPSLWRAMGLETGTPFRAGDVVEIGP